MAAARGGPWRPRIPEPRISVPGLRALRGSRARSGARFQGWGPPPAAEAGAWKLGAVSVPRTFRRPGAFWLRRWPRVLKAALRGSGVSGAIGVVRGAPVLVPPSTPVPSQLSSYFSLSSLLHFPFLLFSTLTFAPSTRDLGPLGSRPRRSQASVRLSVLLFSKPVLDGVRNLESGEVGPSLGLALALSPSYLLAVFLHP